MAMFSPALKADLAFQVNKKFFSECHLFIDTPLPLQVLKQVRNYVEPFELLASSNIAHLHVDVPCVRAHCVRPA